MAFIRELKLRVLLKSICLLISLVRYGVHKGVEAEGVVEVNMSPN